MVYGSSLSEKRVLDVLLGSKKTQTLFSDLEQKILGKFGSILVKLLGYPLSSQSRQVRKNLLSLLENEGINENSKVLDIGCSVGFDCFELAKRFNCRITGVDCDNESIRLATSIKSAFQNNKIGFVNANIEEVDLGGQFDVIYTLEVLEHIKDDKKLIRFLYNLLKRGGYLLISVPYHEHTEEYAEKRFSFEASEETKQHFEGGFHWRSGYNEETLVRLVEGCGFDVKSIHYVYALELEQEIYGPLWFVVSYVLSIFVRLGEKKKIIIEAQKRMV